MRAFIFETSFGNWNPFKNEKCLLFHLKSSYLFKIFKFSSQLFGHVKNGLVEKIRLISKFMTSQPGKQTIAIHISPYISRSKSNQTMKFGQLIEYNMRNIFLEKSCTKCDGETIPRFFSKKSNVSISLDQYSKVLYSLFLLYAKLRAVKMRFWN